MALKLPAAEAAKVAIQSIGCGYDISLDLRLKYCKGHPSNCRLIEIDENEGREVVLPGGISIPNVSKSIKCDKGEHTRFRSDVLSFQQMSEQFNQEVSVNGKIPSGLFNTMFEFSGSWQKDAAYTKTLAFDGVFITLYSVALEKSQMVLCDYVKKEVPSTWDPAALARFIEKFGTHVIVGIKMGGKDVIYMKQQHSSSLLPADVQKRLKTMADKRFSGANEQGGIESQQAHQNEKFEIREHRLRFADPNISGSYAHKEDTVCICKRRGGSDSRGLMHNQWLQSVDQEPDVISMSFIPITSLLNGISGSGFLSHAINLYLRCNYEHRLSKNVAAPVLDPPKIHLFWRIRHAPIVNFEESEQHILWANNRMEKDKPPIEELHQFLEFQLPRQWAPVFGDLPLGPQRRHLSFPSLQFSLLGPRLYVNTTPVDVGKRPVTGLRLYLEGRRSNRLAVHLQHLSSLPKVFQLEDDPNGNFRRESYDRKYYEKVQWKNFSHVCTAPVESDEDLNIVTGAQLELGDYGFKKVLFLRLRFSTVMGATMVKHAEWDGSPGLARKSGLISTLISQHFTSVQKPPPRPDDVNINSAIYPGGPPVPVQAPKLLKFVDTTEMTRGPQEPPGYWVVSGARLMVEKGRISVRVKYSLLTVTQPDDEISE